MTFFTNPPIIAATLKEFRQSDTVSFRISDGSMNLLVHALVGRWTPARYNAPTSIFYMELIR